MKYILITGGSISGIGKGTVASSLGAILKACDKKVTMIKIDPYYNVDAGLMSPYEHGEVFVLDDGSEVDLDLGNYERFLGVELSGMHNITTGKINMTVCEKERRGDYQGQTVRIIPHVVGEIMSWIEKAANATSKAVPDICIIELGGKIGDIEGMIFVEALRQFRDRHRDNFLCCHVNPVSITTLHKHEEFKTALTQDSVSKLRACGLAPDIIVGRSESPMPKPIKEKISLYAQVKVEDIYDFTRLENVYRGPVELNRQGIIISISKCLKIDLSDPAEKLQKWAEISSLAVNAEREVSIALVGKYTGHLDNYFSVMKALEHACFSIKAKPKIVLIESTLLSENNDQAWKDLKTCQCLLIPGGFGVRGTEGKIKAIQWARENKVPFLGVCLGFQLAVLEYARNVLSMPNAESEEFAKEELKNQMDLVIIEMLDYQDPERKLGGTMRLGLKRTRFFKESLLKKFYNDSDVIYERHRHRFEVNPQYVDRFEKGGLKFTGKNDDGSRMEILELSPKDHPYFVAVQFHPEFLSRPFRPSPPYVGLVKAAN